VQRKEKEMHLGRSLIATLAVAAWVSVAQAQPDAQTNQDTGKPEALAGADSAAPASDATVSAASKDPAAQANADPAASVVAKPKPIEPNDTARTSDPVSTKPNKDVQSEGR
jgi:hypothetical protein